jgi:hypothetical protein
MLVTKTSATSIKYFQYSSQQKYLHAQIIFQLTNTSWCPIGESPVLRAKNRIISKSCHFQN